MTPTCFYLDSVGGRQRIHIAPLTTSEALELFPGSAPAALEELSAERFPGNIWVSREDLPAADTVEELASLLRDESLSIIDCTVTVGDCQISTHDDGEATFLCPSEPTALGILSQVAPSHLLTRIVTALQENRGSYISTEADVIAVYATFDDYLARS